MSQTVVAQPQQQQQALIGLGPRCALGPTLETDIVLCNNQDNYGGYLTDQSPFVDKNISTLPDGPQVHPLDTFKAKVNDDIGGACAERDCNNGTNESKNLKETILSKQKPIPTAVIKPSIDGGDSSKSTKEKLNIRNSLESIQSKCSNDEILDDINNSEADRCKQELYEIDLGNPPCLYNHAKDLYSLDESVKANGDAATCPSSKNNNPRKTPNFDDSLTAPAGNGGKGSGRKFSRRSSTLRFENDRPPFKFAGIVVSILGSFCFSISSLCIKLFPQNSPYGLQEKMRAVFVRGLLFMVLCGGSLVYQKSSIKVQRDEIWVNALRSVFGCIGIIGGYVSLCYISLGDSSALVFSSPVWTSLLGHFILGEPLHWILVLALPASLVGIILIAHPAVILNLFVEPKVVDKPALSNLNSALSSDNATDHIYANHNALLLHSSEDDEDANRRRWIGISIALATSLCVSGVYIVLKFRRTTKIQTTTFWLGASSCVAGYIAMIFTGFGEFPSTRESLLLFVNGFFAWLGQTCMQWGLFYENASILSVVRTSDVAISFALSAMFLEEDIYWTSILGAAIIAVVVVLMMLNNWFKSKPPIYDDKDGSERIHSNDPKNVYAIDCDGQKGTADA